MFKSGDLLLLKCPVGNGFYPKGIEVAVTNVENDDTGVSYWIELSSAFYESVWVLVMRGEEATLATRVN